ncbi:MAG TPA: hypothetical protein VI197_20815 [Polyangiaceae bacterium]
MSALDLAPIELEGFSVVPSLDTEALRVVFAGTADLDAVASLGALLPKLHQRAVHHGVPEVQFDFCSLAFMNSSCFKAFVTFIDNAKTAAAGYRIRFITTSKHYWQRRSLEALRRLALGIVLIESDQEG